jgi:hypothetical protein
MADAFTAVELRARLALYVAAESKILSGQNYQIGDRRLQRADLAEVRAEIRQLSRQIEGLEAASGGVARRRKYVIPL